MKLSQIVAKTLVRLLLILLLIALLPFITGNAGSLEHLYIITDNKPALVLPVLLIVGFIVLLVICTRNRYRDANLNWVLVVNIVMLIAYGVMVFVKIRELGA